jgi:hypothetical protein
LIPKEYHIINYAPRGSDEITVQDFPIQGHHQVYLHITAEDDLMKILGVVFRDWNLVADAARNTGVRVFFFKETRFQG